MTDLRRRGGKKPRARRERRTISMGVGEGSMTTQESWVQGLASGFVVESDGEVGTLKGAVNLASPGPDGSL